MREEVTHGFCDRVYALARGIAENYVKEFISGEINCIPLAALATEEYYFPMKKPAVYS